MNNSALNASLSLSEIDIHTLLPQQEPFIMIGKLVYIDDSKILTAYTVDRDNMFVDDGIFSSVGMVENIAQTCAARIGFVNKFLYGKDVQVGFIGAIKNLEISGHAAVGETITTEVTILHEVFGMTLAEAIIRCDGRQLAHAEIKIALKNEA